MESKAVDSVLGTTEVGRNRADKMPADDREQKTGEGYGNKKVELKRKYEAVSKNGDTLELSEEGKKSREHMGMADASLPAKKIISDSGKKISDSILNGYSEAKLKQLYANKEITKQQYDRIMKKKNKGRSI